MSCPNPNGHCWHLNHGSLRPVDLTDAIEDADEYCCMCPATRVHRGPDQHGQYLRKDPEDRWGGIQWDYDIAG
jgi:hypothetical protein